MSVVAVLDPDAPDVFVFDDAATVVFVYDQSSGLDGGELVFMSIVGPIVADVAVGGPIVVLCGPAGDMGEI